jgi:hypothetical protein
MRSFLKYWGACFRLTLVIYERTDPALTLLGYIAAAIGAVTAAALLPADWPNWATGLVSAAAALAVIFLVVAPVRLWAQDQKQIGDCGSF